jgi:hypothetical protein
MRNKFTHIDLSDGMEDEYGNEVECPAAIYSCDDCGAYAPRKEDVVHHKNCVPGDCERWQAHYEGRQQ